MAARPRSLWLAVGTVVVGAALAWREGPWLPAAPALLLAALAAALLMQLVTNLQNDVGFYLRGGDALPGRRGLPRASSLGWLRPAQLHAAIALLALLSLALGIGLAAWRGWPVLAIGAASLLAAWAYMGGPRPIAYTPAGEAVAALFFGPVGVLGTQWLLSDRVSAVGALGAALPGLLAGLALGMNNARDEAHDGRLGRRTLAVVLGGPRMRWLLRAVLLLAMAWPALLWGVSGVWPLPWLALPLAWGLWRGLASAEDGPSWNRLLMRAFGLQLMSGALLALALLAR